MGKKRTEFIMGMEINLVNGILMRKLQNRKTCQKKELQKRIEHALCYTGDKPNILTVGYEHASLYY